MKKLLACILSAMFSANLAFGWGPEKGNIPGDLSVGGDATIGDDLTVTDDADIGGDITITGTAYIDNIDDVGQDGVEIAIDNTVAITGGLTVSTDTALTGTLDVTGVGTFTTVAISTDSPDGLLHVSYNAGAANNVYIDNNDHNNTLPVLHLRKNDIRTAGQMATTDNGDYLGRIAFAGVDGALTYDLAGSISAVQSGTPTSTQVPAEIQILGSNGSGINTSQLIATSTGYVQIGAGTSVDYADGIGDGHFDNDCEIDGTLYPATFVAPLVDTTTTPTVEFQFGRAQDIAGAWKLYLATATDDANSWVEQ